MTSGLPHDECSADTASTTSVTVSESVGERSAAARWTRSTSRSTVQPSRCRLALPPCRQIGDTEPGLAAPGIGRGFTLQGGTLLR